MAVEERDPVSGYLTTGHEWNGIKELNTPVPRAVYFFLWATFLYSVVYWILMPAWPLGVTYTRGLLGLDQRDIVTAQVKEAAVDRAKWTKLIETESYEAIQLDKRLMGIVRQTGATLFGDNCAACHGRAATGGHGFPTLVSQAFLWGGTPDAIAETIRVGINASHPDTRVSQMPAFGRDGMLTRDKIDDVVDYVRSLSMPAVAQSIAPEKLARGKAVFTENCVACHGDNATGSTDVGAPNLRDLSWIYGGNAQTVFTSVWGGRQGQMPSWEARLSPLDRKILALYIVDLRVTGP
ncbi:cytochrome-c oxidase, cbb3-type subunit III [Tardiphaga alba]|uniref:Cbb3-type cytochrome c oxidase subunit n=1 Tax=Tardiphaga alba TaxID=340268 RepID=A0ABX8A1Y8_9BRAD|nr:cytochrome-c oxidase, cbb3-type subunit III [Tardiphaga alba]QUS37449.1 cytochrome-c oxidase, cbb3-type subunit III [Tardiphaga alba]